MVTKIRPATKETGNAQRRRWSSLLRASKQVVRQWSGILSMATEIRQQMVAAERKLRASTRTLKKRSKRKSR
jgi:hypothetical protein